MVDEAAYLLQVIHDELTRLDSEIVGRISVDGQTLFAMDQKVRLTASVHRDPGSHASLAHCHVVAEIPLSGQPARLDACVVGIDPARFKALADAAHIWTASFAGPLFSLMHARPVLGATHFDGTNAEGVTGCHGFAGPMIGRQFGAKFDFADLVSTPMFESAAEMAPPGVLHLVKVTLEAQGNGRWTRNLEIDGHAATYADKDWNAGGAAPDKGLASRFAVFHYADQPAAIEARRCIDQAIRQFVLAFQTTDRLQDAIAKLGEQRIAPDLIRRVTDFVPLAFGRLVMIRTGVSFPSEFMRIRPGGESETGLKLMREAVFARAMSIGCELIGGETLAAAKKVALLSPELNVINNALHHGSKLENLALSPTVFSDGQTSPAEIERALKQHEKAVKSAKPWWRFW